MAWNPTSNSNFSVVQKMIDSQRKASTAQRQQYSIDFDPNDHKIKMTEILRFSVVQESIAQFPLVLLHVVSGI